MTLIITSTVYVNSGLTVVMDAGLREQQYTDSILFYIGSAAIKKIVVCDNSGFDYSKVERLSAGAKQHGKEIEFLSFQGDKDKIKQQGKGYGEGEIMAYTLKNSRLLGEGSDFFKVTGRVIVLNIDRIASKVVPGEACFQKVTMNPFSPTDSFRLRTVLSHSNRNVARQPFDAASL